MTTSPKLLRGESPLQVLPELATWIGLNEAIALQQLHYLLSQDNKGMVEDDIKWYRSSAQEWRDEHFKFWDVKVVERTFKNLEDDGFIKARTFTGRSKWYAIDYEAVEQIDRQVPRLTGKKDKRKKASEASIRTKCTNSNEGNEGPEGKTLEEGISTKCTNGLVQNVPTISTKCTTSKNPKNSFKKVSPKGDSGKKPQEDSKKWNNVNKKIVGDKFLELTQVPFPTNPKTKGVWYGWLFEIFELANKDPAETCRIITLVVKDMQKKHLTISSPKSLHWGARAIVSGQELNGAQNGTQRKHDGAAAPNRPEPTAREIEMANEITAAFESKSRAGGHSPKPQMRPLRPILDPDGST